MDSKIQNKADNSTPDNGEDYKRLNPIYFFFTGLISLLYTIFRYVKLDIPFDIYLLAYWVGVLAIPSILALISIFDNLRKKFAKWQLIFTVIACGLAFYGLMGIA